MKYSSILAGVFGLMALAACTNEEDVVLEQPNGLHTITVAYNQGADTRFEGNIQEEDVEIAGQPYSLRYIEGKWTADDKIALVDKENDKKAIYGIKEIKDGGTEATFVYESGDEPTDGTTYMVVFPGEWDGELSDFATQDVLNQKQFNIQNYKHALGEVSCENGAFTNKVTLTPIFNFLFVNEDIAPLNMGNYFTEDDLNDDGVLNRVVTLEGASNTITNYNIGGEKGSITLNNFTFSIKNFGPWVSNHSRIIAFPVLPGQEVQLFFDFGTAVCNVVDNNDGYPVTFTKGGNFYYVRDLNLEFSGPVAEPDLEPAVGRIIGSDGKYYKTTADVPTGVTPEAMVGKWNTGDGYGFAIALEDASNELLSAEVAGEFIYNNDSEWCRNHAIDGDYSDWSTPQISIFNAMINDCGGLDQFNALLEAAGGSKMNAGKYICKDSTYPNYYVYDFVNNKSEVVSGDTQVYVRAYYRIQ